MEQQSKFDQIRKEGRLLIEFIRGSNLYNLNNKDSDIDTGGVFISKPEEHLGFLHYHSQESDERHDTTWYEVGEFARLICKSNPTVLEALFVPENKIIGEIHPWMKLFRDNRDKFITKDCFNPFFGYAKSQIEKARGLNKKITNPVYERLTPLDFCYKTNDTGGSEPLKDFLKNSGLKQEYCGLVALDHMHEIYNLYYDFGSHMRDNFQQGLKALLTFTKRTFGKLLLTKFYKPLGYRGIIDSELGNELRLSPIPKNELCICAFSYNASGYSTHCREYKEYKEWEKMRNVKRYESNLNKSYDAKNITHCFRLIHMAKEIAEGKGIILERTWDHDFLMDVRNHKFEYEEIIKMLEQEKQAMNEAMERSTIPDHIDPEEVNKILIQIRLEQLRDL